VTRLPGSVLRKIFACFIIAVGVRMLFTPGRPKPANDAAPTVQGEAGQVRPAQPVPDQRAGREQAPGVGAKATEGTPVQARAGVDAGRLA
jgi:uncharacterized membrane protein YfcA